MSFAEHEKIISQLDNGLSKVKAQDIFEQLELFQYRYPELDREELTLHLQDFQKYSKKESFISEPAAMKLLGKTAVELWALFPKIKSNKTHQIEFLEYLCALYSKSYTELNEIGMNEVIRKALLQVRGAALEVKEKEGKLKELKTCVSGKDYRVILKFFWSIYSILLMIQMRTRSM